MIFGKDTPFYGWLYPPVFLFVAAALALLPYLVALAVYQAATLVLYLWMLRGILSSSTVLSPQAPKGEEAGAAAQRGHRGLWLLVAIASPAVFVNIGHGHNGFLTAALIGGALLLLDRKPVLAGVLFGLLVYKPHVGIMIPLVLIVTGRWRVLAAATTTALALVAVTALAFGPDIWRSFVNALPFVREAVLEQGGTGWHKIQGVFSWVRMWGGSVPLAYAMQGAAMAILAVVLAWLWRSDASYRLKAAALPLVAILASPYSLDYDFVVLASAIAFLAVEGADRGFHAWEKTALALLWFLPLIARTLAEQALIPLGVPVMSLMLLLVLRRATAETGVFQRWHSAAHTIK